MKKIFLFCLAVLAHASPILLQKSKLSVMAPTCWHETKITQRKECEDKNLVCCLPPNDMKAKCLASCSPGKVIDPQTGQAPKTPQQDVSKMIEKKTDVGCKGKLKVEPSGESYQWTADGNFYVRDVFDGPDSNKIVVHLVQKGISKEGYCHIGLVSVQKCSQSGTALLTYISHAVTKLGCSGIDLQDDAHVEYNGQKGRMRIIYALKHDGKSWYESKGFQPMHEGYKDAKKVVMAESLGTVKTLIEGSGELSGFEASFDRFSGKCKDGSTFWACMQDAEASTEDDRKKALYEFTNGFFCKRGWEKLTATKDQEEFVNAMTIFGNDWPSFDKPL